MQYALKYFKPIDGKDAWVAGIGKMGPYLTTVPADAMRFATKHEAKSNALHPLTPLRVVRAPRV